MRTLADRLKALGYQEIAANKWSNPDGTEIYMTVERQYKTTIMNWGPYAGKVVPCYGEPKRVLKHWYLADSAAGGTIIHGSGTLTGLVRWLEARAAQ